MSLSQGDVCLLMVNGVLGIAGVTVHVPVGVVSSMPSVRVTIQGIVN